MWIVLFTPSLLDSQDKNIILEALNFLRPYYDGSKTHIEFVCSHVNFDVERKKAGIDDFKNKAWMPSAARIILRLGQAPFPEIRSWTFALNDNKDGFDPWIKTIAAIQEE